MEWKTTALYLLLFTTTLLFAALYRYIPNPKQLKSLRQYTLLITLFIRALYAQELQKLFPSLCQSEFCIFLMYTPVYVPLLAALWFPETSLCLMLLSAINLLWFLFFGRLLLHPVWLLMVGFALPWFLLLPCVSNDVFRLAISEIVDIALLLIDYLPPVVLTELLFLVIQSVLLGRAFFDLPYDRAPFKFFLCVNLFKQYSRVKQCRLQTWYLQQWDVIFSLAVLLQYFTLP